MPESGYRSFVCEVEPGDILLTYQEHGPVSDVICLPDGSPSAVKLVFTDGTNMTFRHRVSTVWVLA